jgi:cell division protein FtsL
MFKIFYFFLIGTVLVSFYIWQQTQSVRMGYSVDQVRHECDIWEQQNRQLRLKVNCLLSMERLDKVAKDRKLMSPDAKNIVYLKD